VTDTATGGKITSTKEIDNRIISQLRTEWETENLVASGSAPVVKKYNDPVRDKELARRGALLDAQRNLAAKVSTIRLTATVIMSDLMATDFAQSRLDAVLQDVTVLAETFNEEAQRWDVTVQMPKVKLLKVVEEVNH